jgi:hypothetical protein
MTPTLNTSDRSLTELAQAKFLRYDFDSKKLIETNIIRVIFENVKDIFGFKNTTDKNLLADKIFIYLENHQELFIPENLEKIEKLCQHAGIFQKKDTESQSAFQKKLIRLFNKIQLMINNSFQDENNIISDRLSSLKDEQKFHLKTSCISDKIFQSHCAFELPEYEKVLNESAEKFDLDEEENPQQAFDSSSENTSADANTKQRQLLTIENQFIDEESLSENEVAESDSYSFDSAIEEKEPNSEEAIEMNSSKISLFDEKPDKEESLLRKIGKVVLPILGLSFLGFVIGSKCEFSATSIECTSTDVVINVFNKIDFLSQMIPSLQKEIKHTIKPIEMPSSIEIPSSIIAAPSIEAFLDSASFPVSERLLLHAVGDVFGDRALEGWTFDQINTYFLDVLRAKLDSMKLCDTAMQDEFCLQYAGIHYSELEKKLKLASEIDEHFRISSASEFSTYLHGKISALQPGESLFFPGGWYKHAIIHELVKQIDGKVTFRTYNTEEEDSEMQARALIGLETVYLPFIERNNIEINHFCSPEILASLQELVNDKGGEDKLGSYDFTHRVLEVIGGDISDKIYTAEEMRTSQQSGTCTYQSLLAAFTQNLKDQKQSERFTFEAELKALNDYDKLNHYSYSENMQMHNLMEKGKAAFAVRVGRWKDKGVIFNEELPVILKVLHRIDVNLEAANQIRTQQIIQSYPSLSLIPKLDAKLHPSLSVFSRDDLISKNQKNFNDFKGSTIVFSNVQNWQVDPKNLIADMSKFQSEINLAISNNQFSNAQEMIRQVVLKLPFHDPNFWNRFDKKSANKMVSIYSNLADNLTDLILKYAAENKIEKGFLKPSDYLTMLKLLWGADQTIRECKNELRFDSIYQNAMDVFFDNQAVVFPITEVEWQVEFNRIRTYWQQEKEKKKRDDFFGFDRKNVVISIQHIGVMPELKWAIQWLQKNPVVLSKLEKNIASRWTNLKEKLKKNWSELLSPERYKERSDDLDEGFENIGFLKKALVTIGNLPHPKLHDADIPMQRVLPDEFYALRRLSLQSLTMVAGLMHSYEGDHIVPVINDYSHIHLFPNEIYWGNVGHDNQLSYPPHEWNFVDSLSMPAHDTGIFSYLFSDQQTKISEYSFANHKVTASTRRRILPNQIILEAISNHKQLDVGVLSLSSTAPLQIVETLGFFYSHLSKMNKQDYQDTFEFLMLDAGLLLSEMTNSNDSQVLANRLAEFCIHGFHLFLKSSDSSSAYFFLKMNRRIGELVHQYHSEYPNHFPNNFASPFADTKQWIARLLELKELPRSLKANVARELLSIYRTQATLTAEEWADFIAAAIQLNILEPHLLKGDMSLHFEAKEALNHRYYDLQEFKKHPKKDWIFNEVVKKTKGIASENNWHIEYPYAKSVNEDFVIDLIQGELYQKQRGKHTIIPDIISQNAQFITHFGAKELWQADEIVPNHFEFSDEKGILYQVYKNPSESKLHFKCKFHDIWYTECEEVTKKKLFVGKTAWKSAETNALIYTAKGTPVYSIERPLENYTINQLNENAEKTGLIVANLSENDPLRKLLERFDDNDYTTVLINNESGQPLAVEFNRYGLTFTAKQHPKTDEWELFSDQYEGMKLSKSQGLSVLSNHSNYLLLESEKEGKIEQKVLLPLLTFKHKAEGSTLDICDERGDAFQNEYQAYLVNIDPKTGDLNPKEDLVRLNLAMRYLWKQEYAKANSYLQYFAAHDRVFSSSEVEMLESIVHLPNGDMHPYAQALRFRADALLLRNKNLFPDLCPYKEGPLLKSDLKVLTRYLENLEYMGEYRLTTEEEILIYQKFAFEVPLVSHFGNFLESRSYGLIQKDKSIYKETSKEFIEFKKSELSEKIILEEAIKQKDSKNSSILKNSLAQNFVNAFSVIKSGSQATVEELRAVICSIAGFTNELDAVKDRSEFLKILDNILKMKKRSNDNIESSLALILSFLRKSPDQFDTHFNFDNIYENTQQMLLSEKTLPEGYTYQFTRQEAAILPVQEIPAVCMILPEISPFGGKPVIPRLSDYFNKESIIEKNEVIRRAKELQSEVFSKKINDSFAQAKFNNIKQKLNAHANKMEKLTEVRYSLNDIQKLHPLKNHLMEERVARGNELVFLQQQIESLLNRPFEDTTEQSLREIKFSGKIDSPISMEEALKLFLQQDSEQYQIRNPALITLEVEKINKLMQSFLERATYLQQMDKVTEKLEEVIRLKIDNASEADLQKTIDELAHLNKQRRMYSTAQHPEYLLFEYQQGILLKENQVKLLDQLEIKNGKIGAPQHLGVVAEAIPGMGKTFAVLPILSLLNADGEYISINMIPEPLLESMNPQIRASLKTTAGNLLENIKFTRSTKDESNDLKILGARLNRIRDERRVLSLVPSSAYSLYLRFIEQFEQEYVSRQTSDSFLARISKVGGQVYDYFFSKASNDKSLETPKEESFENKQKIFSDILTLFKTKGKLIIDEIDDVLNNKKSFDFTLGAKQPLEKIYRDTTSSTFLYLATNKPIGEKFALGFGLYHGTQGLTEELYHQEIKSLLTEALLSNKFNEKNPEFNTFIQQLNNEEKVILENFLNGKNILTGRQLLLAKASTDIQDRFAIYFEYFNEFLPLILPKNFQEHYGKDPTNPQSEVAIPYQQSNPSLGNTFGTDPETSFSTTKMQLERGISESTVEREVRSIIATIRRYIELNPDKSLEEAPSYEEYLNLTGGKDIANILNPSKEDIKKITELVNANPVVQIELINKYVLPEISVFPSQLNANSPVIGMLFHTIQGMSGTLWNAETFTKLIQQIHESETSAEILGLIWRDRGAISEIALPNSTMTKKEAIGKILSQVYFRNEFKPGSFIDTSAIFRGFHNEDIAREMLLLDCWKNTSIKGVIFYDEQNKLKVMKLVNEIPTAVDLEGCGLTREELVAYWDQKHTRGSDLKIDKEGSATLVFGKDTILQDIEQSALRMRDLAKEQRLNIVVSNKDAQVIRARIKQWAGEDVEELKLEHLIYYAVSLQAERQGRENFSALKQKMNTILLEKVYGILIDPEIPFETKFSIYSDTRSLFVDDSCIRPFELYAQPIEQHEKEQVLTIIQDNFLKSPAMQAFRQNRELLKRFKESEILAELEKLIQSEKGQLVDQISISSSVYGKEKVLQMETAKETKKEAEKDLETVKSTQDNTRLFIEPHKWPHEGFFSAGYVSRIASSVNLILGEANIPGAHLIDKNLLGTLNLFPTELTELRDRFGFYQKNHHFIMPVQNKKTLTWQIVLLDQNDAAQFKDFLNKDAQNPNLREKRDVKNCLYHLNAKTQHSGSEIIPYETFENDPELLHLLVQAKFLAGKSSYTTAELPILEAWIKKDPKQLFELYKHVLRFKEESREAFVDSDLENIFKSWGVN